jgi:hypothetical protein
MVRTKLRDLLVDPAVQKKGRPAAAQCSGALQLGAYAPLALRASFYGGEQASQPSAALAQRAPLWNAERADLFL